MNQNTTIIPPVLIKTTSFYSQYTIEPEDIGNDSFVSYDISLTTNNEWRVEFYNNTIGIYDTREMAESMMKRHHYKLIKMNIRHETEG